MAESIRQVLFAPSPTTFIFPNPDGWTIESWEWGSEQRNAKRRKLQPSSGWKWLQGQGQHRGQLIGGCLDVMDWLRGTPVWPEPAQWRNSILFLETSEDRPSPTLVTYMLRALAATGALNEVRGILYGRPYGEETSFAVYDDVLLRVLTEQGLTSIPVITRMDFGHTDPKLTLPIGVMTEIDCDAQQIRLVEPATIW
jgi:muramoyltetrapeptide carboxypeptidase LdcA involved in peptidoglycan recycling